MGNFVEDVCALVSVIVSRENEPGESFTDEQLDALLENFDDKNNMLIMMASYIAGDFTVESWRERMQDFWPAWDEVGPTKETE